MRLYSFLAMAILVNSFTTSMSMPSLDSNKEMDGSEPAQSRVYERPERSTVMRNEGDSAQSGVYERPERSTVMRNEEVDASGRQSFPTLGLRARVKRQWGGGYDGGGATKTIIIKKTII